MCSVKALEPQLNDDPQALFAITRDDDVLVGHFYHHEHAEIACAALTKLKHQLKEILLMNKTELTKHVAQRAGLTQTQALAAISALETTITNVLRGGGDVTFDWLWFIHSKRTRCAYWP